MSMVSSGGAHARSQLALFGRSLVIAITAALAALAPPAEAFDFQDGRLQIHGYVEEQIRGIAEDFSWADNLDLVQWYNILSVEAEYDFAPDGWGPFDVLSGFARIDVRYDCVWTRACGIFPSANAFGDRVAKLPGYKTTGRQSGYLGQSFVGNQVSYSSAPYAEPTEQGRYSRLKYAPVIDPRTGLDRAVLVHQNPRRPATTDQIDGLVGLFAIAGANGIFEADGDVKTVVDPTTGLFTTVDDDPAYFYFSRQTRCKFGARKTPGGANGIGNQLIGPIDPRCNIQTAGALRFRPNPFNPGDPSPLIVDPATGQIRGGSGELPARPASELLLTERPQKGVTQGAYYTSPKFRAFLQQDKGDNFDQNFTEAELAWNRGGSQEDEKEFKEGYLDMEFFDSRLWIRAGKQNIVWGKTELFRTTDQFNPVDLALASLPSLEESRIALWSVRGIWSFYDVGPLEDVRLEVAANVDNFEPVDIGQCGEPFTALVACNKRTALWAHGFTGYALAGEDQPPDWWDDASGLEWGARVEFRAGKFSFQVSDFFGYDDFPNVDLITSYERNVDPNTGRPRRAGATSACVTGYETGCLPIESNFTIGLNDPHVVDPLRNTGAFPANSGLGTQRSRQVLSEAQPVNQQLYTIICATSIGFNSLDRSACAQSVFNSTVNALTNQPTSNLTPGARKGTLRISSLLSNILAGNRTAATLATNFLTGTPVPLVPLNEDVCDAFLSNNHGNGQPGCSNIIGRTASTFFNAPGLSTLNEVLTDEQEALLGCGPFYGTDCEADGIDLLNVEASVLMQSMVGIEGTYSDAYFAQNFNGWMYGNGLAQPGTTGFRGTPVALHNDDGRILQVAGSRGPGDVGYDPTQDGTIAFVGPKFGQCAGATQLSIPCTDLVGTTLQGGGYGDAAGQVFKSELAALSFNTQSLLVAFSVPDATAAATGRIELDELDASNSFSRAPNQCSFAQPQYCSNNKAFFSISGTQRNSVRAGGNGTFGRRDFIWQSGGEGVLQYQKRNVFGFSADFAEDVTKSNWSGEATWISNNQYTDNDSFTGRSDSDTVNMTISVDRPTFINFLNPNRTFFFNSQIFFQYITSYKAGFVSNGPFNMLGTFTVQTGYFQDRLLPSLTFVYDLNSDSGAMLPQISYRFTENFSATVGMNFFFGRWEYVDKAIAPLGVVGTEVGRNAYQDGVENGLSVVRERDEAYLRLRYTF
jgi:hypothetical protein